MKLLLATTTAAITVLIAFIAITATHGDDNVRVLHPQMKYTVESVRGDGTEMICASDVYSHPILGTPHRQIAHLNAQMFTFLRPGQRFEVKGNGPISDSTQNAADFIHIIP